MDTPNWSYHGCCFFDTEAGRVPTGRVAIFTSENVQALQKAHFVGCQKS
jgi:hypothetical protein